MALECKREAPMLTLHLLGLVAKAAIWAGLIFVFIYAAMKMLRLWTPHRRRRYWNSVAAIGIMLGVMPLFGLRYDLTWHCTRGAPTAVAADSSTGMQRD